MDWLRNAWYVAMWSEQLETRVMTTRRILDEPILLFRDETGAVHALTDRCPHRFAPLHRGRLLDGGRVQCGYHGLVFDGGGRCVHNPHGDGRIPPAAKVRAYPLVERHSIVWIWMGEPDAADVATIPDFRFLDVDAGYRVSKRDCIEMDASDTLIADNLLDLSHISFLHDGILGNEDTIPAAIEVREDGDTLYVSRRSHDVRVPGLFDMLFRRDGGRVDLWTTMRWNAPGCMVNDAGVTSVGGRHEDGTGIFGAHFLTPSTPTRTYYHFAAARQNPLPGTDAPEVVAELSRLRRMAFEEQDEPMIREQQEVVTSLGPGYKPMLLAIDAGPVRYKRILERLKAKERAPQAAA